MKGTSSQSITRQDETVPGNNVGKQSNSNVERTLGHVEPTMGGVVTDANTKFPAWCSSINSRFISFKRAPFSIPLHLTPTTLGKSSKESLLFLSSTSPHRPKSGTRRNLLTGGLNTEGRETSPSVPRLSPPLSPALHRTL